uniref:Uncharacterized protein n=1 Tax=Quercus lobata TaxID=97700 RepID=A0A7N2MA15_QUELO
MLYLVDASKDFIKGFLVYDPFNDIGHLRYIDLPVEQDFSPKDLILFGVFRGCLWIIQLPERPSLNEILNGIRSDVNFLAFHPNDAELVLLKFGSYIVSCNMHTGDLNMAGQIPDGMDDFSNVRPPIFLLGQPSWPTLLPPRPLELE